MRKAQQRAYMLLQWADMVDKWIAGTLVRLIPFSPTNYEKWVLGEASDLNCSN
jgi:hypothetical protein